MNIVDFPSWKPSRCAFPRPSEPTPPCTLIDCHVFEANDRAERSNLSSRSQFNDTSKHQEDVDFDELGAGLRC